MKISVLSTGGTFEKVYGQGIGIKDFSFPTESYVKGISRFCPSLNIDVMYDKDDAKDSLDMTEADRSKIAQWCKGEESNYIIVVHGTDTMISTADVVAKENIQKTIVFTGASQPARMKDSDADFNLGGAIIAAQVCGPGVYIVMNGNVFSWDKCKKTVAGNFVAKEENDE